MSVSRLLQAGRLHVIDTSVWIDVRRACPPDIFKNLWSQISDAIARGEIRCPDTVLAEVERNSTDGLEQTLKSYAGLFVPLDLDLQNALRAVLECGQDLVDPSGQFDRADPYLIALAQCWGGTVVTQERARRGTTGRKRIPDVCRELQVPCVTWDEFLREVGWQF